MLRFFRLCLHFVHAVIITQNFLCDTVYMALYNYGKHFSITVHAAGECGGSYAGLLASERDG